MTAEAMRPRAESFRGAMWESPQPPFATVDEAAAWIEAEYRQEKSRANKSASDARHALRVALGSGADYVWMVAPGGKLDMLREEAETIAGAARWWTSNEAALFVLTGRSPVWGIGIRHSLGAITVTTRGDVPEADLLAEYRKARRASGERWLTTQQQMLLILERRTPGMSWPQRCQIWKGWCEKDPDLTAFSGWRNLRRAHREIVSARGSQRPSNTERELQQPTLRAPWEVEEPPKRTEFVTEDPPLRIRNQIERIDRGSESWPPIGSSAAAAILDWFRHHPHRHELWLKIVKRLDELEKLERAAAPGGRGDQD